ncbi:MAG: HAMP domain-containing protein [Deltaproteobacteria bacterium]|nr:HAMP domain-containing protein [Deltaproteobacteria bacterium]
MRSLFLRILVTFWLAMAVIAAAYALIFVRSESSWRRERLAYLVGHTLHSEGRAVAERVEREGEAAAVEAWRELDRRTGLRGTLFCGPELAPRAALAAPSDALRELAREAADAGELRSKLDADLDRFAVPLSGGATPRCVAAGEMPHPTRFERWLGMDTAWLRLLVALLVGGVVGGLLARQLVRPIHRLREAARRLEAGDLTTRVGPTLGRRRDELATLGRDFDRMAERIESLVEGERRLLRDVSHELRSPLARIQVALQLARGKAGEAAAGALDQIERDAERLSELVGQILTVTKLEHAPDERRTAPVALAELLRQVCDDADFEARSRGRRVELSPPGPATVRGVEEVLRRAVENVVRNAVRWTADGTTVEVRLERTTGAGGEARVRVHVRDHGPGVPEAELTGIFQPFRRVDDARRREDGGVGLGLSITERAVRVHGGMVEARNHPEGGLEVLLELPAEPAA